MKKLLSALFLGCLIISSLSVIAQKEIIYAGTYSQRPSEGIYVYEFDRSANTFTLIQTTPEIKDPNFLAIHPNGKFLYAVNLKVSAEGPKTDVVSAFSIDPKTGKLNLINQVPTYGKGACHISTDNKGKYIFVTHYTSGSLSEFNINKDGSIGDSIQTIKYTGKGTNRRQDAPHTHSTLVSPDNQFVYVADLGTDKVMIYQLNPKNGQLTATDPAFATTNPGSGPRHFDFHPTMDTFYLAEEISSTVSVFSRNKATGSLTALQTLSALPAGAPARNMIADIHCRPDGRFVYVSNRGHNSIAIFKVETDGKLSLIANEPVQGDHPRNFLMDPKGEFILVANRNTDQTIQFKIDKESGLLKSSGTVLSIPEGVCIKLHTLK